MRRKFLSCLLCLAMALTLLPAALAADSAAEPDQSTPKTYTVTVADAQHGKVTASPASGEAGTKVTLTVTPDDGYALDTLTVKQANGTAVKVTNNTFTLPAADVTVTATFGRLRLSANAVSVQAGKSAAVTATVTGYAGKHVYAISVDTSVVTTSASGTTVQVKGVAQGTATVYVVMADTNAMTLEQVEADPGAQKLQVTVTRASSSGNNHAWLSGGGGGGTPATPTSRFTDVEAGSWYESGVTFAVNRGLFNGVGANQFAPQQNMTRAMLMTVLARLAGQSTSGGATWFEKGMAWATAQGISDGTDPEGNITREQLVTMLYRYAQSPAATGGLDGFADAASVSDWAQAAMQWAVQKGILTGKDGGRLDPQGAATRAEVAIILQRYVEKG